jgi:predicted ATPase/DNA-binding XRE family transcriptional regulator
VATDNALDLHNPRDDRDRYSIATLLREFRLAAGLSQAELAERADMSTGAIGSLEQGLRRAPYRSTLVNLADALQLTDEQRDLLYEVAKTGRSRRRRAPADVSFTSNAPARLTSFVQRAETTEIARLLTEHRLVTVTGFAGVGKTRTVLEVVASHNSSDVVFIDLSPIKDDDFVVLEIASAFRTSIDDAGRALDDLAAALRDRCALVVLDNCEQVITGVATVVLALIRSCPKITIVATSREPLGLLSEVIYRLPFLSVPPNGARLSVGSEYTALELFISRAQAVDARLRFSPEDLEAAADVCRRLEGIPLAIELAAGRASAFGIVGLRDCLNDLSFGRTAKDLPARHQTMTAAISWSFGLLTSPEQILVRRLSTLVGNFSLRCAETVCADDRLPAESIPDLVVQLVQKSLIESKPEKTGYRYSMLASVRAFASSCLIIAGEAEANEDRLADYLLSLVRDVEGDDASFVVVPEFDNIRAAVEAKLRRGSDDDVATAAALVGTFRRLWYATGRHPDLRRLCELIFARLDERKHFRVAALLASAVVGGTGKARRDRPLIEHAIFLNEQAGYYASAAAHLVTLGILCTKRNLQNEALELAQRAEALLSKVAPDHRAQHFVRTNLAFIWSEAKEFARARKYIEAVDALLFESSDSSSKTHDLVARNSALAEIEYASGNYAAARTLCVDAIEIKRDGNDQLAYDAGLQLMIIASDLKLREIDSAKVQCKAILASWDIIAKSGYEDFICNLTQCVATIIAARGEFGTAAQLMGCSDALFARFDLVRGYQERMTYRDLRDVLEREIEPDKLSELESAGAQIRITEVREFMSSLLAD